MYERCSHNRRCIRECRGCQACSGVWDGVVQGVLQRAYGGGIGGEEIVLVVYGQGGNSARSGWRGWGGVGSAWIRWWCVEMCIEGSGICRGM